MGISVDPFTYFTHPQASTADNHQLFSVSVFSGLGGSFLLLFRFYVSVDLIFFFSLWLISFSILFSEVQPSRLKWQDFLPFYGLVIFPCVHAHTYHFSFVHSSIHGLLGYLCILAIVNNAVVEVYIFSSELFSSPLNQYQKLELLDHTDVLSLVFWGASILLSIVVAPVYTPTNNGTFLSIFVICCLFDNSHSNRCEVIPHYHFDLHFFN